VDEAAGRVVRPYAVTGGRTRPDRDDFDLISLIQTNDGNGPEPAAEGPAGPEHEAILELCRSPLTVAEVASDVDLPVGVVRILLGDLLDHGLIHIRRPSRAAQFPDVGVLKEVIDGLSAL
jgi:hypothetical protein